MYKNYVASVFNIFSGIFLVLILSISVSTKSFANDMKQSPDAGSVSYLGSDNEQMSFVMNYDNGNGEKYFVTIADAEGNVLFEGVYSERKFVKTFKVPSDAGTLTFSVSSFRNKSERKFVAIAERKFYEDVIVTRPVVKP